MRPIDADVLMDILADRLIRVSERYGFDSAVSGAVAGAMRLVDAQPTIKPEPKTGKWIDSWRSKIDGTRYWYRECDHCGYERNDCDSEKDSNFCPNCGADMRSEEE